MNTLSEISWILMSGNKDKSSGLETSNFRIDRSTDFDYVAMSKMRIIIDIRDIDKSSLSHVRKRMIGSSHCSNRSDHGATFVLYRDAAGFAIGAGHPVRP
uniref:Uncharacterized protein n=1 Tax=Spongospora subterranea TaxID=70186 RepID=A0A0H5R3A0_9EUKA|eukprot:CRZ02439.1 hypothetical protein [Spongospora subterranea]